MLEINVDGVPQPKGSKVARTYQPKDGGKIRASMFDDNVATLKVWRAQVLAAATAALEGLDGYPLDGPVGCDLVFRMKRLKSMSDKNTDWVYQWRKPDRDKLERAVLDELTKAGVWVDDGRVAAGETVKRYALPGEEPGVLILVWPL